MINNKTVYLIRHGQTDFNLKGIVQGRGVNSSLNATGKQQAISFFKYYQNINFDKIYISKLKRTYQSIELFITQKNIPFESLSGLDEISWGEKEGKKIIDKDNTGYKILIDNWEKGNYEAKVLNGENPLEVRKRQKQAWKKITNKSKEQNILICTHGRSMRILLTLIFNLELCKMKCFEHQNLGLYILEFKNNNWTLKKKNDGKHLEYSHIT